MTPEQEAVSMLEKAPTESPTPNLKEARRSLDFLFENLAGAEEALDVAFSEHATKLARIMASDGNVLERLTAIATSLAMARDWAEATEKHLLGAPIQQRT